jgi:hypothetical protein
MISWISCINGQFHSFFDFASGRLKINKEKIVRRFFLFFELSGTLLSRPPSTGATWASFSKLKFFAGVPFLRGHLGGKHTLENFLKGKEKVNYFCDCDPMF